MNTFWTLLMTLIALYFVNMAIKMIFDFFAVDMAIFGPFMGWLDAIAIFFALLPTGHNLIFN